ncbi:galectin-related protein-like isoform X1 [Stigmatopora argus]
MAAEQSVARRERKRWKIDCHEPKATVSSEQETEEKLTVPFRGQITGGLHPGRKVVIVGVVDTHPDRFYMALTCGRGTCGEPPRDVALEVCVRFGAQRQVLRRACVGGTWTDAENAIPFFPFIKGQPFKIEVECQSGRFRVLVDAQKLFDFQHQVEALQSVDTLWIKGSLTINKLG